MKRPNWNEWKHTPDVTVWQACALSMQFPRHALPDGASATVTSFTGNPATTKQWGHRAPIGEIEAPPTSNNYFCLSSHYPGNDGVVRRKRSLPEAASITSKAG